MLHRKRSTTQVIKTQVPIRSHQIPMVIYREHRYDWRIAVGKKAVNLRLPNFAQEGAEEDALRWAIQWIEKKFDEDPATFYHFIMPLPQDGQIYQTIFGDFVLELNAASRKRARGAMIDDRLLIQYPDVWTQADKREGLPRLISKLLTARLEAPFSHRIQVLNRQYFGFTYQKVSFKYNTSNWGSCSSAGHLNFSTRLFLAPMQVVDYVIIHELAHLKVPNHSRQFWQTVASAMPEYRKCERWLKIHGQHLYF